MAEECCSNMGCGCGCNTNSLYTDKKCPRCGRKLRVTGSLQRVKVQLTCQDCGYQGHELTMEELRELID